jgi:carbonic anhydrase
MAQNATHAPQESRVTKTFADQVWAKLAAGNQRFISGKTLPHNYVSQRHAVAKGQQPKVAVLSCSDSRVPPEIIFDQGLGDLFVVIVVLGHQNCGAVKAACSGEKMPSSNLDAVIQPILSSCAAGGKPGNDLDFEIRNHVHRSAESLLANSGILKHAQDEGKLSIMEAYYELRTGLVMRLR